MKRKSAYKRGLLLMSLLLLVSCGYKDIDKRAFVVSIGVDKARNNNYHVILKIAVPSPEQKIGEPLFILSEEDSSSISGAIRMIKSKVDKELDFSHAKIIVFGEEVMKEDIQKTLDWFMRRRDIQKIAWVGVGRPNAKEVLQLKRKVERLPSDALFHSFGRTGTESGYIVSEHLFDYRKRITEKGMDPILPIIEAKENKFFEINKTAVFNSDSLQFILSPEETKVLNGLLNRLKKADIRVAKNEDEEAFFIAADVIESNYQITRGPHNQYIVNVHVNIEGSVEEAFEKIHEDELEDKSKIAEKQVKERVMALLKKLREKQVDPIGFGLAFRSTHFSENDWEEWQTIYPDVAFKVNVKVTLQGTGLIN